nr:DNA polymerase III subunit gamma and tau [Actinomycetales bacterium]
HHYPFRLVPPAALGTYLEQLSAEEGVEAASGVIPMVVRAGAGSVRDSLSVLDQLIAGTPGGEISYDVAAALLGFTSASLLDDAVEALAGRDGAALFQVVERVVGSGHDPRRFVEDLLQRLRDLVILAIAGESGESALGSVPQDQLERMRSQATHLGAPLASRAADLTNRALFEMGGATSPRLQLELLCARLLLPAAEAEGGLGARVAALEQAMARGTGFQRAAAQATSSPSQGARQSPARASSQSPPQGAPQPPARPQSQSPATTPTPAASPPRQAQPSPSAGAGQPSASSEREVPSRTPAQRSAEPPVRSAAANARAAAAALRDAEEIAPTPEPGAAGEPLAADVEQRGAAAQQRGARAEQRAAPAEQQAAPAEQPGAPAEQQAAPAERPGESAEQRRARTEEQGVPAGEPSPEQPAVPEPSAAEQSAAAEPGGPDSTLVRRRWGEVLETLGRIRRASWVLVSQSAAVGEMRDGSLHLVFEPPGLVQAFQNGGHRENVALALRETLGLEVEVRGVTGDEGGEPRQDRPGTGPTGGGSGPDGPPPEEPDTYMDHPRSGSDAARGATPPANRIPPSADDLLAAVERARSSRRPETDNRRRQGSRGLPTNRRDQAGTTGQPTAQPGAGGGGAAGGAPASRDHPSGSRDHASSRRHAPGAREREERGYAVEDEPSPDDQDAGDSGIVGITVIERVLGGRRVGEDGR